MQITIKLYAMLTEYLPPNAEKNVGLLELPEGTSVEKVVQQLQLPERYVHLVLINGVYVSPDNLAGATLNDGDTLAIWPPVAGG